MEFKHRITWSIGLNRGGVPYPPTLRQLRADIASQRKTGARCWECEDIARELGITIKEATC